MLKVKNEHAPHQSIIAVTVETMERTPEGQVTGLPVQKFSKIYSVNGKNYKECQDNLKQLLLKLEVELPE